MRLLLLSNSTCFGAGYLDHAEQEIRGHFAGVDRVLFVPFALADQAGYTDRARERLARLGIAVDRLEDAPGAIEMVRRAAGFFVGGGNTFRLLDRLQRPGLIEAIRSRVMDGVPYMGASAGTVVAAPTIMTTNDMPIVWPASHRALDLLPFQINCHYLDADPASRHMGETREERLVQFLEDNDVPVVGLREGALLVAGGAPTRILLRGTTGARIFRRGTTPQERAPGSTLDDLMTR